MFVGVGLLILVVFGVLWYCGGMFEGVDGVGSLIILAGEPIDGMHMEEDMIRVEVRGVEVKGDKYKRGSRRV